MAITGPFVILTPTIEAPAEKGKLAPRIETLDGKVVGLFWNSFYGGKRLLNEVAEILKAKYELKGVVFRKKDYHGEPAPQHLVDEMVSSCDVVLTALGG